jgi:tetratricopeptide (TPR) repeat protein
MKILISYAHSDLEHHTSLMKHLATLDKVVEVWEESRLQTTPDCVSTLDAQLSHCRLMVLLLSPAFMESPFITRHELVTMFKKHEERGVKFLPVLLRASDLNSLPFNKLSVLPKGLVPIEKSLYPNEEWKVIAQYILNEIKEQPTPQKTILSRLLALENLPQPSTRVIGRIDELQVIDRGFNDKQTNIISIIGNSGVGKSALVYEWLDRLKPRYGDAKCVFTWSFQNQCNRNAYAESSDRFFDRVLAFFGYQETTPLSIEAKAQQLVSYLRQIPSILVLDGLEPLQHMKDSLHSQVGQLADTGLKILLHKLQQQPLGKNSIVLLTSRVPLTDAEATLHHCHYFNLSPLSVGDGAIFLESLGGKGLPRHLTSLSRLCRGYPLALLLLANLLKTFHNSDCTMGEKLLENIDTELNPALSILHFYEATWTEDAPERLLLQLLGLLDRRMRNSEKIELEVKLNAVQVLRHLPDEDNFRVTQYLRSLGLLCQEITHQEQERYDTHPLVRQYFSQQLRQRHPESWQQAHRILFQYFQGVPTQEYPDTLQALMPLYEAVQHGCMAGEYNLALQLFRHRIWREDVAYTARELGVLGQDLATLSHFFIEHWKTPAASLNVDEKLWLCSTVSFYLIALERLPEAYDTLQLAIQCYETQKRWNDAAIYTRKLARLYLAEGDTAKALQLAEHAAQMENCDAAQQSLNQACMAMMLHQCGRISEALEIFKKLPPLSGIYVAKQVNLQLSCSNDVEMQESLLSRLQSEQQRVFNNLLDQAFQRLALAKLLFSLKRYEDAHPAFEQAIETVRKLNTTIDLPEFLLAYANFHRQQGNFEHSLQLIEEVLEITERCCMPLYQIEACILKANVLLDKKYRKPSLKKASLPASLNFSQQDHSLQFALEAYQMAEKISAEQAYSLVTAALNLLKARLAYHQNRFQEVHPALKVAHHSILALGQEGLLPEWEQLRFELV